MNSAASDFSLSASAWWSARRLRYNVILLLAAPVSGICLLLVWWLFSPRLPCLEITAFSAFFGGLAFLFGLAFANVFYFLGPLSETLLHPTNVHAFRHRLFALGVGFSVAFIFLPVVGNLVVALFAPTSGGSCG